MIEYNDGTFSKPENLKEMLAGLAEDQSRLKDAKAIHIGASAEELEGLKEIQNKENDTETRFAMIASHIAGIEMDVNKILIHLGLDDKTKILPVKP